MAVWYLGVREEWTSVAHAVDAPYSYHAGVGVDRVLLLGGHTAAGFGVLTHQLGLVGTLSRQLSKLTGRGVEVRAIADVGMTLRMLIPRGREIPEMWAQLVLITVGINDALRLTPVAAWQEQLRTLITVIRERTDPRTPILIVQTPSPVMVWDFARLPASIAARHARLLNAATQEVCQTLPHTTYLPFHRAKLEAGEDRLQWRTSMYKKWSLEFIAAVAEKLQ